MVRPAVAAGLALLLAGVPASKADTAEALLEVELQHDVDELRHGVEELRSEIKARRTQSVVYATAADLAAPAVSSLLTDAEAAEVVALAVPEAAKAGDASLGTAMDSAWLLLCGALVMFMHAGFAMLETGCCRAKNASNVLMKNLLNVCVGSLAWYWFGWGFAYGGQKVAEGDRAGKLENRIIGWQEFGGDDFLSNDAAGNIVPDGPKILSWFFQWAFCTTCATIVSGGVAERVKSSTYAMYAFVMAGFIYPVVVAWTWGYGWLSEAANVGYMDFAGSGIVHLTGGVAALVGTIVLGPRKGRFDFPEQFEAHNLPLVVFGTLALWFGWYGFNCGSTLSMHTAARGAMGAQVAMNTTVSSTAGGITVFLLRFIIMKRYDVGGLCNGILAGLVSITAGCGSMECGWALFTGIVGGCVYEASSKLQQKLLIDDPVDASSVHGACGIWGVLAAGFFDFGSGFDQIHAWSGFDCMTDATGNCAKGRGAWLMAAQCYLIGAVVLWSGTISTITFVLLKMTGKLRVDEDVEEAGMDAKMHSPSKAYSMEGAYRQDLPAQSAGQ